MDGYARKSASRNIFTDIHDQLGVHIKGLATKYITVKWLLH